MAEVSWMRPELSYLLFVYYKIRDVLAGADAIKGYRPLSGLVSYGGMGDVGGLVAVNTFPQRNLLHSMRYLPMPNADDRSPENMARYRSYVERAMWYGVTSRTLDGLTGQVFQQKPSVTVPDELKILLDDIDGAGVTMFQQMTKAVDYAIAYGRSGLLTDYSSTDGAVTQADIDAGIARPTITVYAPWQIINWRVEQIGAIKALTLLVLLDMDVYDNSDDFQSLLIEQYRVFEIDDDGTHYVSVYQKNKKTKSTQYGNSQPNKGTVSESGFDLVDYYQPKDKNGKPLTTIPFTFVGSKNNDSVPDKPPLQDLADVNVGHYRNSADYEDAVYMLGQPTPYASGLTPAWVKEIWQGKVIPLGSRTVIPLPVGGVLGLLQVSPNTLAHEAMLQKEQQMIALGAKLIEESNGNQTATGELIDETSETSVLANVATNVSAAYKSALIFAATFVGLTIDPTSESVIVRLNTSFGFARMSAGDRQELVAEWQKGAISWTEMRSIMRTAGVASLADKDAKTEIQQELTDAIATGVIAVPFSSGGGTAGGTGGGPIITAPNINTPPGQAPNPVPPPSKDKPKGKGK